MKRAFCSAAVLMFAAIVSSASTIRIDPAESTVGGGVNVKVQILDVQDLYGWQFDVAFDRAVVHALSVTEGDFLAAGGRTIFIPGSIDNTGGTIRFTASALVGPVAGVSGSGTLATLGFAGVGLGSSPVTLSNLVLLDSASGNISATVQNGSITIVNVVVPEPAPAMTLLVASAAFVAKHRLGRLGRRGTGRFSRKQPACVRFADNQTERCPAEADE